MNIEFRLLLIGSEAEVQIPWNFSFYKKREAFASLE